MADTPADHLALCVDLMRHGEPEGGTRFRGSRDDPLSETGWEQMRRAMPEEVDWQQVICSPLKRCRSFAESLAAERQLPLQVEPDLRELGFGDWEGRVPEEVYREQPGAMEQFWADPVNHPPPGGERMDLFCKRVLGVWDRLLDEFAGRRLLVIAHGGVNRVILGEVLGMPQSHLFRIDIPFAGVSRILVDQGMARLQFHGQQLPGFPQ